MALTADAYLTELWIYETSTREWTDATGWIDLSRPLEQQEINWAGPQTLALSGIGTLALRDLGNSAEPAYLIGSR